MTLLSTSLMSAQTMKEIPGKRFHTMSENGKWLLAFDTGYIGIYNTETDEFQDYDDPMTAYDLGIGNCVTNSGFLVGAVDGRPAILDIDKKEWTNLGIREEDYNKYSMANGITPSRNIIIGYIGTGLSIGQILVKPVIWSMTNEGTYGQYEELPYPEKDFSGCVPKYILPQCISEDGNIIAAQMMTQQNNCLPLVYRKTQDGTWTYEVYDKEVCEPGLEFPDYPTHEPVVPDLYEYMTPEQIEAYKNDSTAYADSVWRYHCGEISTFPKYWPDKKNYASEEANELFNEAWEAYVKEADEMQKMLDTFRDFYAKNVNHLFYGQNAVWMSPNGKYYSTTCEKNYSIGDAALFTIDESLSKHDFEDKLYSHTVTNNGDLFVSNTSTAYVYPAGSTERITLPEWLVSKGETEAAEWLSDRETGTAISSGDGRVISGFYGAPGNYTSWIIKLDETPTGITDIEQSGNSHVKAYDLQGRIVAEGEYNEVRNNLKRGIYIINGRKIVVK